MNRKDISLRCTLMTCKLNRGLVIREESSKVGRDAKKGKAKKAAKKLGETWTRETPLCRLPCAIFRLSTLSNCSRSHASHHLLFVGKPRITTIFVVVFFFSHTQPSFFFASFVLSSSPSSISLRPYRRRIHSRKRRLSFVETSCQRHPIETITSLTVIQQHINQNETLSSHLHHTLVVAAGLNGRCRSS